jgi:hypothetical protein
MGVMSRWILRAAAFWALSIPLSPLVARADDERLGEFLRFVRTGPFEGRLETAVVTYANAAGIQVSLVAAIHYGERRYYEKLQENLARYEVLLYDGIKKSRRRPT